jgi:hypothetical protein
MQVRSATNMMNTMNNNQMPMLTGAAGAYMSCIQNCMNGGSQNQQQKKGSCMQQLGCALDFSMLDMDMAVMGAQTCMMMTINQLGNSPMMNQQNNNNMMNQQNNMMNNMVNQQNNMMNQQQQQQGNMNEQQNGNMMMQQQISRTMMAGILPQDCQCLVNAGAQ